MKIAMALNYKFTTYTKTSTNTKKKTATVAAISYQLQSSLYTDNSVQVVFGLVVFKL